MNTKTDSTAAPDAASPKPITWTDKDYDDLAKSEFEAWPGRPEDSDFLPKNSEVLNPLMVEFRLALMVMHKTKPELVEIAEKMFNEPAGEGADHLLDTFLKGIAHASDFAKAMVSLCEGAEARLLCAVAVAAAREVEE